MALVVRGLTCNSCRTLHSQREAEQLFPRFRKQHHIEAIKPHSTMCHTTLDAGKSPNDQRRQTTDHCGQSQHGPTNTVQSTLATQNEPIALGASVPKNGTQRSEHQATQVNQRRQSQINPAPQPLTEANLKAFNETQRRQVFFNNNTFDQVRPFVPQICLETTTDPSPGPDQPPLDSDASLARLSR